MTHPDGLNIFTVQEGLLVLATTNAFSTIENSSKILAEGKVEQTIDNIWKAIQNVDSDISQRKLDRLSVINRMVEASCPNLTPEGVQEVVSAIARRLDS